VSPELRGLPSALKNVDCRCLDTAEVLEAYLAKRPTVSREEARFVALCTGRVPWPSIEGNPPVDRSRPYFDARSKERR
jgi:hypothetical protein